MASTDRQSPEHFLSLIQRQQRGVLKLYLGFAAGVGKTYEMLQEGHRLKERGTDVVIGIVETHGRSDTAKLVEGLEQIARRRIEYLGVELEEMDLDAILERRPTIALVDELAHTNAPGSRFKKRYQDVEELLRHGINVISTLNIQHLESLQDIIEQATGVKVKERVPDYLLGMADQLVNVDISAEDLRERLKAGKVYPGDRIETSLQNFFTMTNLTRLRELAMEEIAHRLDRLRREKQSKPGPSGDSDRLMVALSSRSPNSAALLRKAARMAERLNAPWYAVYIQTPRERVERVDAGTQRQINNTLELATQLGGIPLQFKGNDVASTMAVVVKELCITHIVMGRTLRPWYYRWLGRSVLEMILHEVRGVDLIIVDHV